MTEPKSLSREELNLLLSVLNDGARGRIGRHIAALEAERDAALADNAALKHEAVDLRAGLREASDAAKRQTQVAEAEASGRRELEADRDEAFVVLRKAGIGPLTAPLQLLVTRLWKDRNKWRDTHAALLEEHRKALVRARNEGLEALALKFDALHDECAGHSPHAAACYLSAAEMASAMKEPE